MAGLFDQVLKLSGIDISGTTLDMKRTTAIAFLITTLSITPFFQTLEGRFDAVKIRERVKRLAADDFEGRGPGNEGTKKGTACGKFCYLVCLFNSSFHFYFFF